MDDFYFLQISQADNIGEFINLFKPIKFIPYRPVSQQLFFFPFQKLFGLNPLPFHMMIFLIHLINSYLLYLLGKRLVKDLFKARLISLMYLIAALHFVSLYSITGSYITFGVFFFLLSFCFWFKFEEKKKSLAYFLSFFAFILGVFSAEIVFSLPLLILLVSKLKNKLRKLVPYFFVILVNISINLFYAGAPKSKAFQLQITSLPSSLRWYVLRFFGLPEGIRNGSTQERSVIYFLFSLLLFTVLASLFYFCRKKKKDLKTIISYLIWIFIAALPFYFMSQHLNPVYGVISFIGFLFLLEKILPSKLFFVYSFIFIILSFVAVRLLLHTHWTVRRSQLAGHWLNKAKQDCSKYNAQGYAVLLVNDNSSKDELEITLQNDRALQLLCDNRNLKTIYKIK